MRLTYTLRRYRRDSLSLVCPTNPQAVVNGSRVGLRHYRREAPEYTVSETLNSRN